MKPEYWEEESAEFYDRVWLRNGKPELLPMRYGPVMRFLYLYFGLNCWREDDRSLLEIGCAVGHSYGYLKTFLPVSFLYQGLDISSHHINLARKRYPEATFQLGDALKTVYDDRDFNVVMAVDVLVHNWDVEGLLKEWHRVARHCLIFVTRTIQGRDSVRARQGKTAAPYHILNEDHLDDLCRRLGYEHLLKLSSPDLESHLGEDVYNLPGDLRPEEVNTLYYFLLKDLTPQAAELLVPALPLIERTLTTRVEE